MKNKIKVGWLYPEYMSTYGDRGNITCLEKRCLWRGIEIEVKKINTDANEKDIEDTDLILGGGAQDREQKLVVDDLLKKKKTYTNLFNAGIPGLFVCGSPQLLGEYYETGDGVKLEGLGILDYVTKHGGRDKPRCIGNTAGEVIDERFVLNSPKTIVGFENHGGRTYLGESAKPFAKVLKGFGNNGEDGYEGAIYKNVIACYYHGPFLPKNPHIADWLIKTALEVKYDRVVQLEPLDDKLEWRSHRNMLTRLGIEYEKSAY